MDEAKRLSLNLIQAVLKLTHENKQQKIRHMESLQKSANIFKQATENNQHHQPLLVKHWRATSVGAPFQWYPGADHDFLVDSPLMEFHVSVCQAISN